MSRGGRRRREPVLPAAAQPAARVPRRVRVEGELHQELAVALAEFSDPRLEAVHVTRVLLSADLGHARVLVRCGPSVAAPAERRAAMLAALKGVSGRLGGLLGRRLHLRYAPKLRFIYDEGPEAAARVEELLAEIRDEQAQ